MNQAFGGIVIPLAAAAAAAEAVIRKPNSASRAPAEPLTGFPVAVNRHPEIRIAIIGRH